MRSPFVQRPTLCVGARLRAAPRQTEPVPFTKKTCRTQAIVGLIEGGLASGVMLPGSGTARIVAPGGGSKAADPPLKEGGDEKASELVFHITNGTLTVSVAILDPSQSTLILQNLVFPGLRREPSQLACPFFPILGVFPS